jgi:hypothetical protein
MSNRPSALHIRLRFKSGSEALPGTVEARPRRDDAAADNHTGLSCGESFDGDEQDQLPIIGTEGVKCSSNRGDAAVFGLIGGIRHLGGRETQREISLSLSAASKIAELVKRDRIEPKEGFIPFGHRVDTTPCDLVGAGDEVLGILAGKSTVSRVASERGIGRVE